MLQNATPLRKSAPGPPDEHVSCTAPATENVSLQILLKSSHACHTKPSRFAHSWQGAQSLAPATQNDIWTSKNAPNPSIFYTFDFEMCFTPQRRAPFQHLNFQKWSEHGVFCTFWLRNALRATTACIFSTSQLPNVLRHWSVLYILTSKGASRHNGLHFFDISTSKSGPTMVCFVHFDLEMCVVPQRRATFHLSSDHVAPLFFDPPEPQIIGKTQCFATFLPFRAPASSFFWLFFILFLSLTLPTSAFPSVHIVGSLTS